MYIRKRGTFRAGMHNTNCTKAALKLHQNKVPMQRAKHIRSMHTTCSKWYT
ncbi:hypothetical protein HMPREF9248_0484 [Fannyhessea vaginae PB189-T1-4]|uniref:Uncharacterized protein n=1 Tax=Fannyhessea vaginae PB189-T1-4 TaxID=866774 RepID=A0ABN0AZ09_9ACTN|nr:hypothetical protein HMPREF9248_0484 [Fannyhessea vaginae PB189-T1-4]